MKRIWLTWHHSSRSRNMADAVNADLHEVFITDSKFKRHFQSSIWTIKTLFFTKPEIIFIQYSFLLLMIVDFFKVFSNKKVTIIADCHTKALRRTAPGLLNFLFWPLKKWSFSFVDVMIVHNPGMIDDARKLHSDYLVIPDKIPNNKFVKKDKKEKYCVYAGAFAIDEPVEEVISAADILKGKVKIYWTGKLPKEMKDKQFKNIIFTDYLSFDDYFNLLGNADCVLALTLEQDCLQSAAYEALDLEVPMVLSDTSALFKYFDNTAVYTQINPNEIATSIMEAIKEKEQIILNMKTLKKIRNIEYQELLYNLELKINS